MTLMAHPAMMRDLNDASETPAAVGADKANSAQARQCLDDHAVRIHQHL